MSEMGARGAVNMGGMVSAQAQTKCLLSLIHTFTFVAFLRTCAFTYSVET